MQTLAAFFYICNSSSMKSTVDLLTKKEKEALALWYETPSFMALKKLCELEIEGLGKDALGSPSHEATKYYAGQADMAAKLIKVVGGIYKENVKHKEI